MADDSYLSIAAIAGDEYIRERMNACVTQQEYLDSIVIDPVWGDPPGGVLSWVQNMRYVWASSPGWGDAWTYALAQNVDNPDYEPGRDPTVITDEMILSAVQTLAAPPAPAPSLESAEPQAVEPEPTPEAEAAPEPAAES